MREGPQSLKLGLQGIPAQSESICVGRDVEVALLTGARLHIAHMSTFGSLEYVRFAKKSKLRVTCEVTPHHFTLTDEDVRYDSSYKMNPPLASRSDRDALIAGLADGSVDAIATDHAPHHAASKDVEFDRAPFGILGFVAAALAGRIWLGAALLVLAVANRIIESWAIGWSITRDPGSRSFWRYPLRDLLGFFIWCASYLGRYRAVWRNVQYDLTSDGRAVLRSGQPQGQTPK